MRKEKYLEEWKENQNKRVLTEDEKCWTGWFLAPNQKREAIPKRMFGGRHVFITKANSEVATLSISL